MYKIWSKEIDFSTSGNKTWEKRTYKGHILTLGIEKPQRSEFTRNFSEHNCVRLYNEESWKFYFIVHIECYPESWEKNWTSKFSVKICWHFCDSQRLKSCFFHILLSRKYLSLLWHDPQYSLESFSFNPWKPNLIVSLVQQRSKPISMRSLPGDFKSMPW